AGERYVRAEGALFFFKSGAFHSGVESLGETLHCRRFHPCPEDARRARTWKESNAANGNGKRLPGQARYSVIDIVKPFLRNFADKFQRDVYRLRRNPSSCVRQRFQLALNVP